jgi:hypothetical protein
MSPVQSIYNHPFFRNLIYPQGITYNPFLERCGGGGVLTDIISETFNYDEQNCYLQIFIGSVKGNDEHGGGGLVALKSL